ncbi:ATP-dependent helicase HrpA [Corallococcus sicarius]|uniref:ATP-dependent helicase HrpA n=1 Tax=Corallococcus sicarius TaxID=2316726 RepID=A0A3A8MK03_9BACT|nr:ATP-dependent helicase HrpA [Corallococcus sicarius]
MLASVKGARGVRAIVKHLGLATAGARRAPARGPPQAVWC